MPKRGATAEAAESDAPAPIPTALAPALVAVFDTLPSSNVSRETFVRASSVDCAPPSTIGLNAASAGSTAKSCAMAAKRSLISPCAW